MRIQTIGYGPRDGLHAEDGSLGRFFASNSMADEVPSKSVVGHPVISLEGLLGTSYQMLPPLPESHTIDYSILGVIAQVGMNLLDKRMKIDRPKRSVG